ncbi:hypothetical protein ACFX1W_046949 [Malus domestica]
MLPVRQWVRPSTIKTLSKKVAVARTGGFGSKWRVGMIDHRGRSSPETKSSDLPAKLLKETVQLQFHGIGESGNISFQSGDTGVHGRIASGGFVAGHARRETRIR